jgi:organic radical activating enzyme
MNHPDTFCASPFVGLQINTNGTLVPCCEFNHAISGLGDFLTFREYDQWQSGAMRKLKQDLTNGVKSPGCSNCWSRESVDLSTDTVGSLRISINNMFGNVNADLSTVQSPKSLTVMFGNFCNLRCIQCGPVCSSSHQTEQKLNKSKFEQLDLYRVDHHTEKKWWQTPDFAEFLNKVSQEVQHVFLHGGEPLITPEAIAFLKNIPNPEDIQLSLTTNATVLTDEVYELIKEFKQLDIVVSLEGVGDHNDYLRYGGHWDTIVTNIQRFQTLPNLVHNKVVINHTLQYTSQYSLLPLIDFCHVNNLVLRIGMLSGVDHLSIDAMTAQQHQQFVCSLSATKEIYSQCVDQLDYIMYALKFLDTKVTDNMHEHAAAISNQLRAAEEKYSRCMESINTAEYALNFLSTHLYNDELSKKFYNYINMIDGIRGTSYFEVFGELDK